MPTYTLRYQKYLNIKAHSENNHITVFDLGNTRLMIVANSALTTILPGELPTTLPAFVGYTIKVENIEQTHQFLIDNGFTPKIISTNEVFVSSDEAMGTATIFREVNRHNRTC